jgi:hypothetical protein
MKSQITDDQADKLGRVIDEIENLEYALKMPLPPQMHVEQLSKLIPEKVLKLKEIYIDLTGENPWE